MCRQTRSYSAISSGQSQYSSAVGETFTSVVRIRSRVSLASTPNPSASGVYSSRTISPVVIRPYLCVPRHDGFETVLSGAVDGPHMAPESAIESPGLPGATRFGFGFAFF